MNRTVLKPGQMYEGAIDHGPILVEGNTCLSSVAARTCSQGIAYVGNRMWGRFVTLMAAMVAVAASGDSLAVIDNVCSGRYGGCGAAALSFEPRGDEDRTAEVLAAVKSGATLRFAKGEYHFRSPTKLYYYISNHDNPRQRQCVRPHVRRVRPQGGWICDRASGGRHALLELQRVRSCGEQLLRGDGG